jgi:hypothetical protein
MAKDAVGTRKVERDLASGVQTTRVVEDGGEFRIVAADVDGADGMTWEGSICEGDPLSAEVTYRWHSRRRRDAGYDVAMTSKMTIRATAENFLIAADLEAYEGDKRVFARRWDEEIPRDNI